MHRLKPSADIVPDIDTEVEALVVDFDDILFNFC
jgi:hypothetical protein